MYIYKLFRNANVKMYLGVKERLNYRVSPGSDVRTQINKKGREKDMREIAVNYLLTEEEEQRLQKITKFYKSQLPDISESDVFRFIMLLGCRLDIEERFSQYEQLIELVL